MKKSFWVLAMAVALGGAGYAQDNQANQANDNCASFKMRVVKPSESLDSKMTLPADTTLDQAMVVNPCPPSSRIATRQKPGSPEFEPRQNADGPSLKFNLPDGRIKSPAEVLKQLTTPALPKPERK